MACYTDYSSTLGAHAFRFEWEPNTGATRCTPSGWGDNTKTAYTYNGFDNRSFLRDGIEHQSFVVDGRWSPIQDGGMGAYLGIWINDIHRDNATSQYGNIGIGSMLWCVANKNGTMEILQDNVGEFKNWKNNDWGNNGFLGSSVLRWLSIESGTNTRTETYVNSSGDIPGGRENRRAIWSDWQTFYNHNSYDVPTALFVEPGGNDGPAGQPIWSGALWPRVYWNRKGQAGARNENDESPQRHDATHGVITALVGINWTGCGTRMGNQYHGQATMAVPVIIPDIGPGDCKWIKPPQYSGNGEGLDGVNIQRTTDTTETTVSIRAWVSSWGKQGTFGDDKGQMRLQNGYTSAWTGISSQKDYTWNLTGLTPGAIYYTAAQARNSEEAYTAGTTYSKRIGWRMKQTPGLTHHENNSRWDTPSINVTIDHFGADTADITKDAAQIKKIDYVFNNSATDTSGYTTTGQLTSNSLRIWGREHSVDQNTGFWVHTRSRNGWNTSEWTHTWYETPDRLYRPGCRKQVTWKSHQALNGKSHRVQGGWQELTTRSDKGPDGRQHIADDPQRKTAEKWRNMDLIGTDPTWYHENLPN